MILISNDRTSYCWNCHLDPTGDKWRGSINTWPKKKARLPDKLYFFQFSSFLLIPLHSNIVFHTLFFATYVEVNPDLPSSLHCSIATLCPEIWVRKVVPLAWWSCTRFRHHHNSSKDAEIHIQASKNLIHSFIYPYEIILHRVVKLKERNREKRKRNKGPLS